MVSGNMPTTSEDNMGDMELGGEFGWPACRKPPRTTAPERTLTDRIASMEATLAYYERTPHIRRGKVGPLGSLTFERDDREEDEWNVRISLAKAKLELAATK